MMLIFEIQAVVFRENDGVEIQHATLFSRLLILSPGAG